MSELINALTTNVATNNIKDDNSSPTLGPNAPYYGILAMHASHQIWFSHGTETQVAGSHENTIRYVYEDGSEATPTVVQEVDMICDLKLAITQEKVKDIQNYVSTHTADETLNYIANNYIVTEDGG